MILLRNFLIIVVCFYSNGCSKNMKKDMVWMYQDCIFTFKKVSDVLEKDSQNEVYMLESEVTNKMFKIFIVEKKAQRYIGDIIKTPLEGLKTSDIVIHSENPKLLWDGNNYPEGQSDFPVNLISITVAQNFCDWLNEALNVNNGYFRLPTFVEWNAAIKSKKRKYPWGNNLDFDKFVHNSEAPKPVKSISAGASADGIFDLIGNIQEFIVNDSNIEFPIDGVYRKFKFYSPAGFVGGGFSDKKYFFLSHKILIGYWDNYGSISESIGFRLVFIKYNKKSAN